MTGPQTPTSPFLAFTGWPTLRVVGPDAGAWLNAIVTNDVLSVSRGRGSWGSLLTKQGKVQADLQFVGAQDEILLAVSGGDPQDVRSTLDGYLVMEDAEIEATNLAWVVALGDEGRQALESAQLKVGTLPWGADGVSAGCGSPDAVEQLRQEQSGLALSDSDWQAWLIHHGVPRFGVDYGSSDNLHAASLERRTVDWSKGCYLGQEVVCMQDMRGKVKRRLMRLEAEGPLEIGIDLTAEGAEGKVGQVVSTAGTVGIAQVSAPHFEPGTRVNAGRISATVRGLVG